MCGPEDLGSNPRFGIILGGKIDVDFSQAKSWWVGNKHCSVMHRKKIVEMIALRQVTKKAKKLLIYKVKLQALKMK